MSFLKGANLPIFEQKYSSIKTAQNIKIHLSKIFSNIVSLSKTTRNVAI
jgi:hypothetical protein